MSGLKQGRKTRFFANLAESCLKCDLCDARFWIQSKLDKHYTTHVQEELSCKICEATFLKYADLNQHYFIHKPLQALSCLECDSKYFEHAELLKHMQSTHLDNAFTPQKNPSEKVIGKSYAGLSKSRNEAISMKKIAQIVFSDPQSTTSEVEGAAKQDGSRAQKRKSMLKTNASAEKKESLMWKEPLVSSDVFRIPPSPEASEAQSSNDHDSANKRKEKLQSDLDFEFTTAKRRKDGKIQTVLSSEATKKLSIEENPNLVSCKTKPTRVTKDAGVALSNQTMSEREEKRVEIVVTSKRTSNFVQNAHSKELSTKPSTMKILQVDNGKFREVISDHLQYNGQMQAEQIPISRPLTDYGISPSSNFPIQITPITLNQISSEAEQFEDNRNLQAPLSKELSLKNPKSSKNKIKPEVTLFVVPSQSKHTLMRHKRDNLEANESPKTVTKHSFSNIDLNVDLELASKTRCETNIKRVICFNNSSELNRGINIGRKEDKVATETQLNEKADCQLFKKRSPIKKTVSQRSLTSSDHSLAHKVRKLKLCRVSVVLRRLPDCVLRECNQNGYIPLRNLSKKLFNSQTTSLGNDKRVPSILHHPLKAVEPVTNLKKSAASSSSMPSVPKNVKVVTVSADFMTKLKESFLPKSQSGDASQIRMVVLPQVLNTLQMAQKKAAGEASTAQNVAFKVQTSPAQIKEVQSTEASATEPLHRSVCTEPEDGIHPCSTQTLQSSKMEVPPNRSKISPVTPSEIKNVAISDQPEKVLPSQSRVIVYGIEDMKRDAQRRKEHREKMQEKEKILKKMLAKYEEKEQMKEVKYRVKKVARILEKKTHQLNTIQEKLKNGGKWEQWDLIKELKSLSSGESALEVAELFHRAGFKTLEEKMGVAKSYHLMKEAQKQKEISNEPGHNVLDGKSLQGNQVQQEHDRSSEVLSKSSTPKLPGKNSPKQSQKPFLSMYHFSPTENDSLNSSTIKYSSATKRLSSNARSSSRSGLSRAKNPRLGPINRVQRGGPSKAVGRGKPYGEDPFTDLSMITGEKYILECPCNMPFCNLPHLPQSC